MKTKNKIISIFMCLCLALLSSCSQDSGGEHVTSANTSAAGNADNGENAPVTTESNAADTSSEEAENQPDDERFAYYDLISAEYEKWGKIHNISFYYSNADFSDVNTYLINGKAIFINKDGKINIYDCGRQSEIANFQLDDFSTDYYDGYGDKPYCFYTDVDGGYIYCTPHKNYSGAFYKYDISGNLINQLETEGEFLELIFADGTFITRSGFYDNAKYYLYSEDWKTKTELPNLQVDVGHGIMEKIDTYDAVAKYKNKIYVYASSVPNGADKGYYCFNADIGTWEYVESELQNATYKTTDSPQHFEGNSVGRYFLLNVVTPLLNVIAPLWCTIWKQTRLLPIYQRNRRCFPLIKAEKAI